MAENYGNYLPEVMDEDEIDELLNQNAIAAILNEDVNGNTAGRPEDQWQYDWATNNLGEDSLEGQGRPVNQYGVEIGMDGQPLVVPPPGFNPNLPYRGNYNGQRQTPFQPSPNMTGTPFGQPTVPGVEANPFGPYEPGYDGPQQNPFQPGPEINPFGESEPEEEVFAPIRGSIPGLPPPQPGFNPAIPANPTPNTLPFPEVQQPAGQPQEVQQPLIGFSIRQEYLDGSNSGPLDPQQYPPERFPAPQRQVVLSYGDNDFERQMMMYVDDGPQRIGESLGDYQTRIQRCTFNMGLALRMTPGSALDADVAAQRSHDRRIFNDELEHRDRLTQGQDTFDQAYMANWQAAVQNQRANNARRRATAVERLRREYANFGIHDFPDPAGAGYGDGDDSDFYTHDAIGRPLPRAAPIGMPPPASGLPEQTKKRKRRDPAVEGAASEARCGPCGERSVSCSLKETGYPCDRCVEGNIQAQCVPLKLMGMGTKKGTKRGPYKKSQKQADKEAVDPRKKQTWYKKVGPLGERQEEGEQQEDEEEDDDESSDEEPGMPLLRSDSDSDEPSAPPVASGPSSATRRNQPRSATKRPSPEEEDEEGEEDEEEEEKQPRKKQRTSGLTRYTTTPDGRRVLDPENPWNQRLGLVAPSAASPAQTGIASSNVASTSNTRQARRGNSAPPNAAPSQSNPAMSSRREGLRVRGTGGALTGSPASPIARPPRSNPARGNRRGGLRVTSRAPTGSAASPQSRPARSSRRGGPSRLGGGAPPLSNTRPKKDKPTPCKNCQMKRVVCDMRRPCGNCRKDRERVCASAEALVGSGDSMAARVKEKTSQRNRAPGAYAAPAPSANVDEDEEMMDVGEPSMSDRVDHQRAAVPNSMAEEVLEAESGVWMGSREPSDADVEEQQEDDMGGAMNEGGFFDNSYVARSQNGGSQNGSSENGRSRYGGNNSPNNCWW